MRFGSQCLSNGDGQAYQSDVRKDDLTCNSNSRREALELLPVPHDKDRMESYPSSQACPAVRGDYHKYIDDDLSSF
jgi:hypothetical protein